MPAHIEWNAAHMKRNACPHPTESTLAQLRRARNEMMLMDTEFTLFLTHVGNLTTVKKAPASLRSDACPHPGITCPHHRNTQMVDRACWRKKRASTALSEFECMANAQAGATGLIHLRQLLKGKLRSLESMQKAFKPSSSDRTIG